MSKYKIDLKVPTYVRNEIYYFIFPDSLRYKTSLE